jgi:hypothetical protein
MAVAAAVMTPPPVAAGTTGPTWAGATAPVPANADANPDAGVNATTCPAPGACVAVGGYVSGGKDVLFADTLTNGVWSTTQIPSPPNDNGTDVYLDAISCPTVGWCVATGAYEVTPSNARIPLAAELSGGAWSTVALPLPPATAADPNVSPESFGLSCPAVGWCVDVGSYFDPSNHGQGFIDTLSGGSWTSIMAPLPAGAPAEPGLDLFSASCGAVGSCVAAGPYSASAADVFDVLAAGSWTPIAAPLPPNHAASVQAEVFSVSCPPGSTDCTGVGDYWDTGDQSRNVAWSISDATGAVTTTQVDTPPDVTANPQASLNDVSCPVAGWCMAVGEYQSNAFPQSTTEAAVLSGGVWSVTQPPGMSTAYQWGVLSTVSCSWPGSCAAAGVLNRQPSNNDYALVNTLTDGVWSGNDVVLTSSADPSKQSELSRPSCVAGYCLAGGNYDTFAQPLLETHPNLNGYHEVASDGGLFSFNAPFSGSMGGKPLNAPIVGMAVEPDNGGYYEVASDGVIFAFNAPFSGSMGGHPLNKPIVGMAFDTRTGGYYEVASDGGIFAFDAPFQGSMGGTPINKPVVGMAADTTTGGYYEVASDGGIFAFAAPFSGSMGGHPLNAPIVGITFDYATGGYYEAASDGGLFAFDAPFQGSMGGHPLNKPIVGLASG